MSNNGSGQDFVDFWKYAGARGLMNPTSARQLAGTVRTILAIDNDWENTDVKTLDVDGLLQRFENLLSREYTPKSLQTYGSRFRKAHESYLRYLESPSTWKFETASSRKSTNRTTSKKPKSTESTTKAGSSASPSQHIDAVPINSLDNVVNTIMLRNGRRIQISTPVDFSRSEIESVSQRISHMLNAIAVDDPSDTLR